MAETLLSVSGVLLFGRKVEDLQVIDPLTDLPPGEPIAVRAATVIEIKLTDKLTKLDDVEVKPNHQILVKDQTSTPSDNGIYRLNDSSIPEKTKNHLPDEGQYYRVYVKKGTANGRRKFTISHEGVIVLPKPDSRHGPFTAERPGVYGQVELQLSSQHEPQFARIYGFSFEGLYYDLPTPTLFLVHGDGRLASEIRGQVRRARAPADPSLTGLGSADFQFSDDIVVWSYDKADYTIRMDVQTGMFEDVLLDTVMGSGSGMFEASGMNARGMNARGMNARGMNARGMNARGMNARGNSD